MTFRDFMRVCVERFELPTPRPQTGCSGQAELHAGAPLKRPNCMTVGTDEFTLGDLVKDPLSSYSALSKSSNSIYLLVFGKMIPLHCDWMEDLLTIGTRSSCFEGDVPSRVFSSEFLLEGQQMIPILCVVLGIMLFPTGFTPSLVPLATAMELRERFHFLARTAELHAN